MRENPYVKVSWIPGSTEIRFRENDIWISIDIMEIENQLGMVTYYILDMPIPFLLYLYNIDRFKAYFNNLENVIVCVDSKKFLVIYKWRHLFFNISYIEAGMYLTEP